MRKSKKFIAMPVISLEDGQQVGFIKDLVINPGKAEIAGLVVEQKGWFKEQKIIPYNKVRSIGGDAITIEKSSNVEKPANLPEIINLIKEKSLIIGAKVITEEGVAIGFVDEFLVDENTGKIRELEITGSLINSVIKGRSQLNIDCIKTIGKDILIAFAKAEEQVLKSDGGLQDTMHNIKETTSSLLENTIDKTKKIGKNLKDYTKKTISEKKSKETKTQETIDEIINNYEIEVTDPETITEEVVDIHESSENITEESVEEIVVDTVIIEETKLDPEEKPV